MTEENLVHGAFQTLWVSVGILIFGAIAAFATVGLLWNDCARDRRREAKEKLLNL